MNRYAQGRLSRASFDACSKDLLSARQDLERDNVVSAQEYAETFVKTVWQKFEELVDLSKSKQAEL